MREKVRTGFGQRLVEARTRKGLSQPQLAKLAGVAQGTVGEAETTAIGSKHTAKLAEVLGVRAEWLASGDGPMVDASSWPFTLELLEAVSSLNPKELLRLENSMRAFVGLDALATERVAQRDSQEHVSPSVAVKTKAPVRLPPALADRLVPESTDATEVDRHGEVPSARPHRSRKGTS